MSSPSKQRSLLIPAPPTGNAASTQKLTFANTAPNGKKQKPSQHQQQQQQQPEYMRLADAQARALEKFTLQQHQWDDVSRAIAEKSRKLESATLASTTHLFREKMEETGKLDAAVPPAARSHASNSWEMGLRNGTSATRYEPVGSSFPYPLYCPIRSPDQVSSEHPYLTHILYPPNVTDRISKRDIHSKPIMESQFFKSRQAEFAHHINKKFAHFQATEYFDVHGGPAPRTNERVDESVPQPSVQFIPMESKDGTSGLIDPASATHATTIRNLIAQQQLQQTAVNNLNMASNNNSMAAQQQQVAPLNAVSNNNNNNTKQQQQPQSVGPQIVLSTNNLSFTTSSPDEMKQAIVTLDNTGSTAIYYQWAALPAAPPVTVQGLPGGIENNANESQQQQQQQQQDLSGISLQNNNNNSTPSAQMSSPFSLANPVTGSILPESMKMFCFSFKAKAPGIYTQHMELITVPSGRERIVVTLRGVSLSSDADPVICGSIEEDLNQKCQIAMAEEILKGDIIHKSRENAFAVSDVAVSVKKRENEIQAEKDAPKKLRAERKILWQKANKTMVTVNNTAQPAQQQPVSSNMDHVILNPKDAKKAAAAAALAHSTAFGDQSALPLASARDNNNNETTSAAAPTTPRHSTAVNLHEVESRQSRNQNTENKTLLPFCESAYAALEVIRRRCNEFRGEFESEVGPSKSRLRQQAQILEASASKKGKDGSGATPRGKRGDDEDQEPPPDRAVQLVGSVPAKWNGSLRSLYEDVSVVRTNKVRSTATEAVSAIHRALVACSSVSSTTSTSATSSPSSSSLDTTSLSDIMWLSAGRSWLGNAFDKFERASILAAARIENRATCVSKGINVYGVPPKKGAGGGAASGVGERASTPVHALGADLNAPAANFGGGGGGTGGASASATASNRRGNAAAVAAAQTALNQANAANKSSLTSQESAEDIRQLREESIKQLLLGAISGMISTHDNNMDLVEAATCLPLSSLVIDEADEVIEGRDMEAEPLLDLNTKKRK